MSCAYDNGKRFLNDEVVSSLVKYSRSYQTNADVAACALSALRQLILSEEAVKMVCSHGLMTLPKQILQLDHAPVVLIRSLVGLLRNICADDTRKNYLVSDGIIPLLIYYMSREEYQQDALLMEHILATLAAIALRYPNNSHLIVNSGGIDEIVSIMRRHEQKVSLQRQACLTIRNIASRCPELRRRILDGNVEVMLRQAGRHQECIDEAYAALRDLECEVQFVKLSTDGASFESAYETFGTSKPKFNPVFEETYDIITRIDKESTAPFAKSSRRIDEDQDEDEKDLEGAKGGGAKEHQHSDTCSH
jgi:armadillo repeat-containing protein 6